MAKRKKAQQLRHDMPLEGLLFGFEVPGEMVVAIHNALTFTLENHHKYLEEADNCEHCLQAMEAFREYLGHIIHHTNTKEVKTVLN
jgi:hypothetical protein